MSKLNYALIFNSNIAVFRIGQDGRIFVEKRLKGIYVTAEKLQEARQNLVNAGKAVPLK